MEHIIGLADLWLTLAGVALLLLGLRGRSGRGKRWCCKCWYDMTGVPGLKCPECGRAARDERGLQRRRRSRGAMAAGLVALVLAYGAGVGPRVHARGWDGGKSVVPTLVLIAGLPWLSLTSLDRDLDLDLDPWLAIKEPSLGDELRRRVGDQELRAWERWLLTERCIRGDSKGPPGSEEWARRYQPIVDEMAEVGAPLSETNYHRLLDRAVPRLALTRKRWPSGTAVLLEKPQRVPFRGVGSVSMLKISVVGRTDSSVTFYVDESDMYSMNTELGFTTRDGLRSLGVLESDRSHEIELSLIGWGQTVWQRRIRAPFTIGGEASDILRPLDAAGGPASELPGALRVGSDLSSAGVVLGREAVAALDGAAFAVVAELYYHDAVVATGRVWWSVNRTDVTTDPGGAVALRWLWTPVDRTLMEKNWWQEPGWTVRLRGDAEFALRDLRATRYWAGAVVFERDEAVTWDPEFLQVPRSFRLKDPN